MKEIVAPDCPICDPGTVMEICANNNAFFVCKGNENKPHKADFLETTKNYINGNGKHPQIEAPKQEVVKYP